MTARSTPTAHSARPLEGIRIIEMGQLLAGPFAGALLGYFGAEVIKLEDPQGGDPLRNWRVVKDGTSLWWRSLARNKKSVTLNLRTDEGRQIAKSLILKSDAVIENFRPGLLESWGLGPEELRKEHPKLLFARISGFGQTGPYSAKPGFASVCEAFSGFRFVTGQPGEIPVRSNLSLGDTISGIHAAFGLCLALIAQLRGKQEAGQTVDVAIYESMFNLLEAVVPEYDGAGVVRQPSGTTISGIVPTNTFRCADSKFVLIGGNGDSIFKRLMQAVGRDDMANDSKFANNAQRVTHEQEIDLVLAKWCLEFDSKSVVEILEQARVPVGLIYNAKDMAEDPHYQARGLFEKVEVAGEPLTIPALMPKLDHTPGRTEWPGPELGCHNDEVFGGLLKMDNSEIAALRKKNVL